MKRTTPLALQPIPYQGSKRALAPRISGVFPDGVRTLYEPFAGSGAVTLYAATHGLAERFVIGDAYEPLIGLWGLLIDDPGTLSERYAEIWHGQFPDGKAHFQQVRAEFNETRDPVLLLYLIARCVKNAVRFNRHGQFTQSADNRRTGMKPDRVKRTAYAVSRLLKGRTTLFTGDFTGCIAPATPDDLIYMDPPYQGTTYGPDKRYAEQLCRNKLIETLHQLDRSEVPYILSYDGQTGEKTYGEPLPETIRAKRLLIDAGRSSQATLQGRTDVTLESLYVSQMLVAPAEMPPLRTPERQGSLFA